MVSYNKTKIMRKEVILAILVGLVMGLFITYGVYQARQNQEETAAIDVAELEETPTPTKAADQSGKLTVYHPTDETVLTENSTTLSGQTVAEAHIVIYINETPIVTRADENGNFTQDLTLDDLSNVITVYSIDQDGETYQVRKTVVVYPDELKTATDSAQTENNSDT